ncbi:MAG: hypothetical protein A3D74_05095 [Candidatus Levybacteria bacterium RIFCSPHIGHO2_02_FULL_37_13]|nr:MAG: hypothetical protein A3D74_05095 [Candidatus Levybacteria bacterium RIFCSPHIGHO2_02_FULL_37_13]
MTERYRRTPDRIEAAIEFGLQMRNIRISQGKSGRGVAKLAGISPAYLFVLEQGKNPNTNEPSIPSPDIRNRISAVLGITADIENDDSADTPSGTSKALNYSTLNIRKLDIMSVNEREKAANIVRDGRFDLDGSNNQFNYYLELANLYGSTVVVMQAVIGQLDKDIQELKAKYHIEEDQVMNKPEGERVLNNNTQVESQDISFESELIRSDLTVKRPEDSPVRIEDPRV